MILRTFPTATIRSLSSNANRRSREKSWNGAIQIICPDCDKSSLTIAVWSCFINFESSRISSPVLRSINVINSFKWTSATAAWI